MNTNKHGYGRDTPAACGFAKRYARVRSPLRQMRNPGSQEQVSAFSAFSIVPDDRTASRSRKRPSYLCSSVFICGLTRTPHRG